VYLCKGGNLLDIRRKNFLSLSTIAVLALLSLASHAAAQDSDAAVADDSTTKPAPAIGIIPAPSPVVAPPPAEIQKSGRIFGVLPNFLTVDDPAEIMPITAKQKFSLAARGNFDPFEFVVMGVLAAESQAANDDAPYGQGASGFGKRYGAAFADQTIGNLLVGGVLPSVLHQDPRYFRLGRGSFWHRSAHAVSRIFVTRGDSGRSEVNFSEILGSGMAAGISNLYKPADDRTLGNNISTWGTQMAVDTFGNFMKEFWPDIRHIVFKK
jgi:hypothetical protein